MKDKKSYCDLFLELAKPDELGFSREVSINEFEGKYSVLTLGNGGSWCRKDQALYKKYNVETIRGKGNKIIALKLHGYNKNPLNKAIRADIKRSIKNKRCVILYTSKPQVDHKDGRNDDYHNSLKPENQKESDFQPLSQAANAAKRQHCKNCRKTNIRFDATVLGYSKSQFAGTKEYKGTCVGCYWYDPYEFNKNISIINEEIKQGQ